MSRSSVLHVTIHPAIRYVVFAAAALAIVAGMFAAQAHAADASTTTPTVYNGWGSGPLAGPSLIQIVRKEGPVRGSDPSQASLAGFQHAPVHPGETALAGFQHAPQPVAPPTMAQPAMTAATTTGAPPTITVSLAKAVILYGNR